ncbi:hypothetical protein ACFQ9J_16580 [Streptomyces sp. NPDC056529]|uniref:hypothetical protein n=1 Tax=Streptomyces sp. NPDC056529 TaxID=3345855 RepID=UPI0036C2F1A3
MTSAPACPARRTRRGGRPDVPDAVGPAGRDRHGGPLDGLLLDVHEWRAVEVDDGVALVTALGRWPGGRALYDPRPGEARESGPEVACRFHYTGDTP